MDQSVHAAFKRKVENFRLDEVTEKVLHKMGDRWAICLNQREVAPILQQVHDENGHFGPLIVMQRLRQRFWWPNMAKDVKAYIEGCIQCGQFSHAARSHPLMPIEALEPFQLLGMDFVGPLPKTAQGNRFILHIIDYFSRFSITTPSPDANKETVFQALTKVFDEYVTPAAIYMDPGQHFKNKELQSFLKDAGVAFIYSPSGSSKSTGMVERGNGLLQDTIMKSARARIESMVKGYVDQKEDWDTRLAHGTSMINSRFMDRIGYCPKEILFGVQPSYLGNLTFEFSSGAGLAFRKWVENQSFEWPSEDDMSSVIWRYMEKRTAIRDNVLLNDNKRREDMKIRYDKGVKETRFDPDDLVMLWDISKKGIRAKLTPRWRGLFVVHSLAGEHDVSYRLRQINGKSIQGTFHGDHLRRFRPREGYLIPPLEVPIPTYQNLRDKKKRPELDLQVRAN